MHRGKVSTDTAKSAVAATTPVMPVSIGTGKTLAARTRTERRPVSGVGKKQVRAKGIDGGGASAKRVIGGEDGSPPECATPSAIAPALSAIDRQVSPLAVPVNFNRIATSLEMRRDTGERGIYPLAGALLDAGVLVGADWDGVSVSLSVSEGLTRWLDERFDTSDLRLNLNLEITDNIKNMGISQYSYYYDEKMWREHYGSTGDLPSAPIAGFCLAVRSEDICTYNVAGWVRTVEHYTNTTVATNLMGLVNATSHLTGGWHITMAHSRLSQWSDSEDDDDPTAAGPDPDQTVEGYRGMLRDFNNAVPEYAHHFDRDIDVLRQGLDILAKKPATADSQVVKQILHVATQIAQYQEEVEALLNKTAVDTKKYSAWNQFSHLDWVSDISSYPRHTITWNDQPEEGYDPVCAVYDDELESLFQSESTNIFWTQFFTLGEHTDESTIATADRFIGTLGVAVELLVAQMTIIVSFGKLLDLLDGATRGSDLGPRSSFFARGKSGLLMNVLGGGE
jgi:hypothetical protein